VNADFREKNAASSFWVAILYYKNYGILKKMSPNMPRFEVNKKKVLPFLAGMERKEVR
jgi:hypothetical protein